MSTERTKKMLEAARSTALARELMERWTVEGVAVKLAIHNRDEDKAAKSRALQAELLTEGRRLTEEANTIYEGLRQ